MKEKRVVVVDNNFFIPKPWRISVCNMEVEAPLPVFISINLSNVEPLHEHTAVALMDRHSCELTTSHPVFIAYRSAKGVLVSTLENPLLYLHPASAILKVLDLDHSYLVPPLNQDDPLDRHLLYTTPIDHLISLVHEHWDDTLSKEVCSHRFRTLGYKNNNEELSIIPRLTFKRAMVKELSSILESGLAFPDDASHCLFTIQFQRYFAQ